MNKLNGACAATSAEAAMSGPPSIAEAMMGGRRDFVEITLGFREG